jgi:hypothetical protein
VETSGRCRFDFDEINQSMDGTVDTPNCVSGVQTWHLACVARTATPVADVCPD